MSNNNKDKTVKGSSAGNFTPSSYQKGAASGADFERTKLVGDDNDTLRRRHTFLKHISLEGLFGTADDDDSNEGDHGHAAQKSVWNRRQRKRLVLVLGATIFVLATVSFFVKARNREPLSYDSPKSDLPAANCGTDPIEDLKISSAVENVRNGVVAADTELCSDVGLKILQEHNGNAVDAAVATALCLGVANPASSGIGGGGMILVHSDMASHNAKVSHEKYIPPSFNDERDEDKRDPFNLSKGQKVTEFIDCREVAPTASYRDMFLSQSSENGGLAIAVPGELRGFEVAHSRHGKLPWKAVVEPAMILARDGLEVGHYLAHEIRINRKRVKAFPNLNKLLTKNNDGVTYLKEGDVIKQPVLAKTLEAIMDGGADALYKGKRGEELAKDIRDAGGIITAKDLADYRPSLRTPLVARDVGGFTIVGAPPPSSGGAAIMAAARFLSGYHNPYASFPEDLSEHRLVEASRHAFSIRMSLSDPKYNTNVTMDAVEDMVWNTFMEELRKKTMDNTTLLLSSYGGTKWAKLSDEQGKGEAVDAKEGDRRRLSESVRTHGRRFGYLEDHGTTHLSVIDKDRNAVSITSSVNTYFGSKVLAPSTGMILNNQMDDFATPGKPNHFGLHPSEANYIEPGKKPLSSMAPTMIFWPDHEEDDAEKGSIDNLGKVVLVLGASGGPKIISAVLQVFVNFCWRGMSLFDSVTHPRLHDQLMYHGKVVTTWEKCPLLSGPTLEVSEHTVEALANRSHKLLHVSYMGTVQAVSVDLETGTLTGVSDVRKVGKSKGY